jgi:hypothetical protein
MATLSFHRTSAFLLPSSGISVHSFISQPTITKRHSKHVFARLTSEELIPLKVLFGNPENTSPILSPDGNYLAYLAPSDQGVLNIYLRDLKNNAINIDSSSTDNKWDKSQDRLITNDPKRGIRNVAWAYDNKTILYMQDRDGDENFHLYAVDITQPSTDDGTPPSLDLTPGANVKAQNIITNYRFPNEILVGTNERNSKVFDMYRCFYKTGEKYLDTMNPGDVIGWKTEDTSFEIRCARVRNEVDSSTTIRVRKSADLIASNDEDTEWRDVFHFPYGEEGGLLDFCPDQKTAYLTSSIGRETTALLKVDIESGETLEEIYSNEKCNVGGVTLDKDSKKIRALTYNYARTVRAISCILIWIIYRCPLQFIRHMYHRNVYFTTRS